MRNAGAVATLCLVSLFVTPRAASAQRLPAPICDPSPQAVARDTASLRETIRESLVFLLTEPERGLDLRALERIQASIGIEFVGPGRVVPAPADDPTRRPPAGTSPGEPPGVITDWVGVNPATCNQYRIRVPAQTRSIVTGRARDKDLGRANPGPGFRVDDVLRPGDWYVPQQEQYGPPQTGPYFSACVDTRIRWGTAGGRGRSRVSVRTVKPRPARGQCRAAASSRRRTASSCATGTTSRSSERRAAGRSGRLR